MAKHRSMKIRMSAAWRVLTAKQVLTLFPQNITDDGGMVRITMVGNNKLPSGYTVFEKVLTLMAKGIIESKDGEQIGANDE